MGQPDLSRSRAPRRAFFATLLAIAIVASGALATGASAATPGAAAWGYNVHGMLGNGSKETVNLYQPVSTVAGVTEVSTGQRFGLLLTSGGRVWSFGEDSNGQLGDGTTKTSQLTPEELSLEGVSAISAGNETGLALKGGEVYEWGVETCKETPNIHTTPVKVEGLSHVIAIAAGSKGLATGKTAGHELALLENHHVMAWGRGERGQLGDGKAENSCTPVEVKGLEHVTSISAGGATSFAVLEGGTAKAWGENFRGQLGIGNTTTQHEPVSISGLTGVTQISGGDETTLALLSSGKVDAWGTNKSGLLGQGTAGEEISNVPIEVPGLSGVTAVAAGEVDNGETPHNMALIGESGTVKDWGYGGKGELGDGTFTSKFSPTTVTGLKEVTSIASGEHFSLAGGTAVPIVSSISPSSSESGTTVTIHGYNLLEASPVKFGSVSSSSITEDTETQIKAVVPVEAPRVVQVTVTTPVGTSGLSEGSEFRIVPAGKLEFGRCTKGTTGKYGNSKCTELSETGKNEWTTELTNRKFTVSHKAGAELANSGSQLVECTGTGGGSGEFVAPKAVTLTLTFSGCKNAKGTCTTTGATEGQLKTTTLEGAIGWENKELNQVAIELVPVNEGEDVVDFTCGGTTYEVHGVVFGAITPTNSMTTSFKIKFSGSKGKQSIEHFEGGSGEEQLSTRIEGLLGGQSDLVDTQTVTTEEEVELNTVV